jgi:hypothetical protein
MCIKFFQKSTFFIRFWNDVKRSLHYVVGVGVSDHQKGDNGAPIPRLRGHRRVISFLQDRKIVSVSNLIKPVDLYIRVYCEASKQRVHTFNISLTTARRWSPLPYFSSFSTTLLANFCLAKPRRPQSTTICTMESLSSSRPYWRAC